METTAEAPLGLDAPAEPNTDPIDESGTLAYRLEELVIEMIWHAEDAERTLIERAAALNAAAAVIALDGKGPFYRNYFDRLFWVGRPPG